MKSRLLQTALCLLAGGGLIVGAFLLLGVGVADIQGMAARTRPLWLVVLCLVYGLIIVATACKWRFVVESYGAMFPFSFFLRYSSLAFSLNSLVSPLFTTTVVRSVAMKYGRQQVPAVSTVARTVWDNGFDLLVGAVLFPASLFFLLDILDGWTALLVALVSLGAAGGLATFHAGAVFALTCSVLSRFRSLSALTKRLSAVLEAPLLERGAIFRLYFMSVARQFLLVCRAVIIVHLFSLDLNVANVVASVSIIQLSMLLNVAPTNLGVTEWTWVGLLALGGDAADQAALYALASRVVNLIVGLALTGLFWLGARLAGEGTGTAS